MQCFRTGQSSELDVPPTDHTDSDNDDIQTADNSKQRLVNIVNIVKMLYFIFQSIYFKKKERYNKL